ncbi:MAG: hypothetical protein OXU76_01700, partial [Alphaproteobacteria bacterium]|nr:hypothetical protein [Alphaproteobacteria bacterium]
MLILQVRINLANALFYAYKAVWNRQASSDFAKMEIDFTKMNGCGNDFVVIDARKHGLQGLELTPPQIQNIAKRDNFITKGCDQVL